MCMCFNVFLRVCVCMRVCLCSSICLNAVGLSVSQVSVIRIISKSHQAEPLISHLAWWTPTWGTTEGRHVPLCLSFSLTLSVCLSVHDYTCLFPKGWRALSVELNFLLIKINAISTLNVAAVAMVIKIELITSFSSWAWLEPSSVVNAWFAYTTQLMFHDCMAQNLTSCGRNYTKMIRERIGWLYIFWNGSSNKAA